METQGRVDAAPATIFLSAVRGFWTCFGYPCQRGYRLFSMKGDGE